MTPFSISTPLSKLWYHGLCVPSSPSGRSYPRGHLLVRRLDPRSHTGLRPSKSSSTTGRFLLESVGEPTKKVVCQKHPDSRAIRRTRRVWGSCSFVAIGGLGRLRSAVVPPLTSARDRVWADSGKDFLRPLSHHALLVNANRFFPLRISDSSAHAPRFLASC